MDGLQNLIKIAIASSRIFLGAMIWHYGLYLDI